MLMQLVAGWRGRGPTAGKGTAGLCRRILRRPQWSLLHDFSLVCFIAVAAVTLLQARTLEQAIEAELLRHDAEYSRQLVQSIVDAQQLAQHFAKVDGDSGTQALRVNTLARSLGSVAAMPDVLSAKAYARDGHVLWSTDSSLIGQHLGPNDELEAAMRGRTVARRGAVVGGQPVRKAEHAHLARTQTHFVENYLPVVRDPGGAPVGVVELYRLPSDLNATLASSARLVWISSLAGGLVVYLSTMGLVRRASRLLQEQRARMVEAEALAVVGEIAASVAHSIRNPLASIRSSAELQAELGPEAPAGLALETVSHVDRIEHLVRTLLSYTASSEAPGSTELEAVLRDAVERFAPSFRQQGTGLRLLVDGALLPVHGQAVLLAQVLNSLLANALEATSVGDQVELRARCERGHVQVEVVDSGPGIEPSRLSDVFKPFHTTKPRGLGMGLALVRRTLARIGGEIELSSRPGCTCARLRLRLASKLTDDNDFS